MARGNSARGIQLDSMDVEALVALRDRITTHLEQRRLQLQEDLERLSNAVDDGSQMANGRHRGWRPGRPPLTAGRRGRRGGRRGKRGAGKAMILKALHDAGGKGTTADLRKTLGSHVGKTPLSVALVSVVRSGAIMKRGSGRGAVYSLAAGSNGQAPRRARKSREVATSAQ